VIAVDAVRVCLSALDQAEDLGAVVDRDDDAVLAKAAEVDRSGGGELAGRAITVKDWIDVAGFACEGESRERTGRRPARDATAVARLRAAGAIVVAKTQPGGEHPIHGRCDHPLDPTRTPGGTSSGEAALIGRGASTLGLGSDSGGSIRLPAAWCGVVGLKPSFGLVPTTGHFPRVGHRSDGRTVIGPMSTSVADAAAVLRAVRGPDRIDAGCCPVPLGDTASLGLDGLRVAVVAPDHRWPVAASTAEAVDRAVAHLQRNGATDAGVLDGLDLSQSLDITQRYWARRSLTGAECDQQLGDWDRFASRLQRATVDFDVVLSPVVADVAPPHRPLTGEDYVFTLPWSLTGWPAMSLPFGADNATGLPLAVQIVAPRWHDHVVIAVAAALESHARAQRPSSARWVGPNA